MDTQHLKGISVTPLLQINHPKGNIFHGLKRFDQDYYGFGEAYFTAINYNDIKGWKKHTEMVMNLIVPVGEVDFYFFSEHENKTCLITAGEANYSRVTVQPGIWTAFAGKSSGLNLVLNIASIVHDPGEAINADISTYPLHGSVIL